MSDINGMDHWSPERYRSESWSGARRMETPPPPKPVVEPDSTGGGSKPEPQPIPQDG